MTNLPKVTPEIINAYKEEIGKVGSASTTKRKEVSIKRFFDWAHAQGKIDENPFGQKPADVSTTAQVTKPKRKAGFKTYATVGLTIGIIILIFLLTRKLQLPIPFITNFAFNGVPESQIQTVQNNNVANQISNASGSAIPAGSAVIGSWNLFTKLKLMDSTGSPQVGSQTLSFKIYDQATGGKVLYTSDPQAVTTDTNGSALISLDKVPTDLFFQNNQLFLEPEIGGNAMAARIPVSTASTPSNLGGYFPANPDTGAAAETVPVVDATGSLNLAGTSPAINSKAGNLLIQGQAVTIRSAAGGNGNIEISPDGFGITHFLFTGNGENFLNAQAPNLTNGSLFYGIVGNNAAGTGYSLIKLESGSSPTTKFSVDGSGNTYASGNLNVGGNIQTLGTTRITSGGALTNITDYSQNSGNFVVNQKPGDFASVTKSGTALSDVLTLTLDERGKPATSNTDYSTLVLNRYDGSNDAMALLVKNGNARFNGQLRLGNFTSNPDSIGKGSLVFNTTDNKVYVWDGTTWNAVGSGGSSAFSAITGGTNTGAAMVVGSGASLTYSGTGTINASSLEGATWQAPGTIGSTTPNSGAFTSLAVNTGSVTTTSTTANLFTANATTINMGINGSGSVNIGGGSSANGCTFNDATGALTCAGNITTLATSGTQGFWSLNAGALYPNSNSVDFLVGANSTGSAKFAVTGVNTGGTPTATIAGSIANVATYLTGNGTFSTTNAQDLTLGSLTTGNVVVNSRGNSALTADGANLTAGGTFTLPNSNTLTGAVNYVQASGGYSVGGGTTYYFNGSGNINAAGITGTSVTDTGLTASKVVFTDASKVLTSTGTVGADQGGTGFSSYTVGDLLYANTTSTLAKLNDVATGNALISGGVGVAPSWGKIVLGTHTTGNYVSSATGTANQVTVSPTTGDIVISIPSDFRAPGTVNAVSGLYTGAIAGTQRIDATGNLTNIGTTQINGQTYTWPATGGSSGYALTTNGGGTLSWSPASGLGTNYWTLATGALYPQNNTVDLLVGGDATTSAKFAFKNVLTGTPTATISGTVANVATYLDGNGNLSTTNMRDLTLGSSTTGNVVVNSRGSVAITANGSNLTTGNNLTVAGIAYFANGTSYYIDGSGNANLNAGTFAGNVAVNGGSLTTTQTTANLFNTTATTLNVGGAATTLNLQGASGLTANIGNANGATAINVTSGTGAQTFTSSTTTATTTNGSFVYRNSAITSGDLIYANAGNPSTFTGNFLKFDNAGTTKYFIDSSGNASESGSLTIGNGSVIKSAYGPLTLQYKSGANAWTDDLVIHDVSGDIDLAGGSGSTGCTINNSIGTITCSAGISASSVAFNNITTGTNTTASMVVDTGASLNYSNSGTINASSLEGKTWEVPGTIGSTTPNTAAFTTLSSNSTTNLGQGTGVVTINSSGALNLTGALNSTWTLGAHTLALTTSNFNLSSTGVVTLAGGQTVDLTTPAATALTIDSGTTGALNIGNQSNAKTITIGNATGGTALNLTSGTGPQTFTSSNATGTTTNGSFVFKDAALSSGDLIYATSAGALTNGNLIKLGTGGDTTFSGNAIYADLDNTGQGGLGFTGNFLKFDNAQSTKFRLGSSGVLTLANGGTIDNSTNNQINLNVGASGTLLLTSSTTGTLANSAGALAINAAATGLNLQTDGSIDVNIAGGSGATGCTVTNLTGSLTCSGNITTTATSGTQGWWQLNGSDLAPTSTGYNLAIGGTTSAAPFYVTATTGNITTAGNIAINGGSLTSTAATFNLLNGNSAQTINFASGTGGNTINIAGTGATGADTINIGTGATGADTINIGSANAGAVTVRSNAALSLIGSTNSVITLPNFTVDASGNVGAAGVGQFGGTTTTTYSRFGTATTGHGLSASNDLLIGGKLELGGNFFLNNNQVFNSGGTATVILSATPSNINNYHTLTNGSWLVQNNTNNGIAALMVDQDKGGDIFAASASGAMRFKIDLNGKLYDQYVSGGIALGDANNTALVGFGASSLVGAVNELKNSNVQVSRNDYQSWANTYTAKAEGTLTNPNMAPQGIFFDTFADTTKMDSVNSTSSGAIRVSDANAPSVKPAAPNRVGLTGGQTYNAATNDNDGHAYLGSNTVNKIYYYDRTRDSSPQVQVELGIDPNWYNGVTLSVATTSAQFSQNSTVPQKNPNLSTSYNGSLIKVTGTNASPKTIYITIKSPTTFDWTNYNGEAATGVTITPGTAQTLGGTGASVTFTNASYNTGDIFRIASWYIETSSSTRGAKAQFPERSYIIAEGTSGSGNIDIIDADTQKLWMHFSSAISNILGANHIPNSVNILNGKLYIADTFATLEFVDFGRDSAGYYDTTGVNQYKGSVSQRNSGLGTFLLGSSPSLVNNAVNDVAATVIPNQPTGQVTVSGWGYIVNTATAAITEQVNLPYKFNDIPRVTVAYAGGTGSSTAPNTLSNCTVQSNVIDAQAFTITSSNFQVGLGVTTGGNFTAGNYNCYTWTATGTVSPKQFVVAAEGTSTSGASDIINETDGTVAHIESAAGVATSQYYQTKTAIAGNTLYLAANDASGGTKTLLNAYYGIHGITTEPAGSADVERGWVYGVGNSGAGSGTKIVVLGTSTGTGQITSLSATPNTSTIDGKSNTIYVGTTSGATVIQEIQGLGTSGSTSNVHDGQEENSGSVKYYTNSYISEEMVGDIRLMTPLAGTSALSANTTLVSPDTDASIKAISLTTKGVVPTHVSGVRGNGLSFSGAANAWLCAGATGTCTNNTNVDFTTGVFSVGAWVKTTNHGASEGRLLDHRGSGTTGYFLEVNSGKGYFYLYDGTNELFVSGNRIINDGNWHYVVGVRDTQTTVKLYVDGQLDNSNSNASLASLTNTSPLGIGSANGTAGNYNGSLDELMITGTALSAGQIKHMYEVGYRALQSHATTLGGGGADTNQQLGYISTGTNTVGDARPDYNNQFMYVGLNSTTLGGLSKIDLNGDTNIKTYNSSANVPSGGTLLIDEDVNTIAVGYQLEAVGSAASGVKSMSPDNNSNNLTGSLFSKTQTLNSATKFAYLWTSFVTDANDTSNGINVYACNAYSTKALCDSNSAWVLGTILITDSSQTPPEREYSFSFPIAGSNLTFKFDFARGSTKTNTYIARYGTTWASSVGGADIAERYKSTEPTYPGDILTIASPPDASGSAYVSLSRTPYDQKLIGIVTTNPGIVMDNNLVDLNFNAASRNSPDRPAVALAGRVPVKVSTINGRIEVGDYITSSDIPGVGVKATKAGSTIGKALQSFDCSTDNSNLQNASDSVTLDAAQSATPIKQVCTGTVMVLVNVSWYDPDVYVTGVGNIQFSKDLADAQHVIYKIVRVTVDGASETVDRVGTFGQIVAGNIQSGAVITKEFATDNFVALQGQVDNLISKNIKTNLISPIANSTDVAVRIGSEATPSGQLIIQNASGSAVATIDSTGNATFSGTVNSSQLAVNSEATISGTLYADSIKSKSLDDIQKLLTQVETDQNILLAATNAANLNATSSANLTQLAVANIYITSQAAINSLSVSQSLTIGTDLVLGSGGNTIDTLAAPLKIQSLAMAPVEIMNGLVTIDTHGNVQIAGNLAVAGKITAPAIDTETLNATGSATFSNLTIAAPDATQAAVINNGVITTNSTVGSAVIPAGVSEITIRNPRVTDYTLVYVTPTSSTQNYVLYIKNKQAGQFIVGFTNPLAIDVNFNWWIVGVANLVQN